MQQGWVCVHLFVSPPPTIPSKCLLRFTCWDQATKDAEKEAAERVVYVSDWANRMRFCCSALLLKITHSFSPSSYLWSLVLSKWVIVRLRLVPSEAVSPLLDYFHVTSLPTTFWYTSESSFLLIPRRGCGPTFKSDSAVKCMKFIQSTVNDT